MLLWLLLLHLAIHLLTATRHAPPTKTIAGRPIDQKYVIKHIDSCPDVGYFFKREPAPNSLDPGPCFLCFCQGQKTAVCWRRENKRCDVESFHFHGLGKRDTRVRRSPAGFSDIFFRDATRDIFNKGNSEQCKPFESSFSDGCPPADWCIGCTVCDCDANGRWDCHILSFCPDKKGGRKLKKRKQHINSPDMLPLITPNKTIAKKTTALKSTPKLNTTKRTNKPKSQTKSIARVNTPHPKARVVKKSTPKETTKRPKKRPPLRYQKIAPKNATSRPKIINKNVATHKPVDMAKRSKMQKVFNSNNDTVKIAQQVVKRVMAAVQRMVRNEMRNMTKLISPNPKPAYKKINKRHVTKGTGKNTHLKKFIIRNKRNVMAIDNDFVFNITTVPEVSEKVTMNLSETTETPNGSTSITTDRVELATPTPTLNESEYYKYTLGADHLTTFKPIVVNDMYQTETVVNLMSTERLKQLSFDPTIDDGNEITSFLDTVPEANDLKFKKWSFVKILKEKHDQNKVKSIEKYRRKKPIEIHRPKNKVYTKDVERKFVTKKYNVVKVVNSPLMEQENTNQNQSAPQAIRRKISDLQSSVSQLFKQFRTNNTVISKTKHRRVGIVKYLKKLFSKIFNHRKSGTEGMNEHKVLETLCDTFGPCKVNIKDKLLLKTKLKMLNVETVKILKTIHIIKGLLQLVNIPTINEEDKRKPNFGNDIKKLNNILKGTYNKDDAVPLSATQTTQIDYIKKNTKHFVLSVSKFATLLNEIVAVLIQNNKNNTDNFNRILRNTEHENEDDPFQNFRNLLLRYNLVQNDFMKRMYRQLNEFENKMKEKKVSDNEYKDLNNSVAIETFSRNIITNLRQLKQVAQTLTSSGRVKRNTLNMLKEDSIEYVLMVMEYLMKQNYPLDAAPANDGIDLLIDAIRNAPDIKSVKKKVLPYKPGTPILSDSVQKSDSSEDSGSVSIKLSKEDSKSSNDNSKDLVDQILEDDKENDERPQYDRKMDETTEPVYFLRAEETPSMDTDIIIETKSQSPPTVVQQAVKVITYDDNTVKSYIDVDNDKKEPDIGDNEEKELDDIGQSNGAALPKTFPPNIDNEVIPLDATTPTTEALDIQDHSGESEGSNIGNYLDQTLESNKKKFKFDTKTQIDWIEENFGMDPSRLSNLTQVNDIITAPSNIANATDKTTNSTKYDVSGTTNEVDDTKKKKKSKAEEVMLRKQMDLLNSLDYGTARSEFEESDSKDGNDEKYSSDSFPTYFV